jgi:hypothetical protein
VRLRVRANTAATGESDDGHANIHFTFNFNDETDILKHKI